MSNPISRDYIQAGLGGAGGLTRNFQQSVAQDRNFGQSSGSWNESLTIQACQQPLYNTTHDYILFDTNDALNYNTLPTVNQGFFDSGAAFYMQSYASAPSGIYAATLSIGQSQGSLSFPLRGILKVLLISRDGKQTVDITPSNIPNQALPWSVGYTQPISFNSFSLFGRRTAFYPRLSFSGFVPKQNRFSLAPDNNSVIFSGSSS